MYTVHIDDPGDARLADYVSLRDVQLRTSLEAEHGLFLAEGEKVIRRAVEAGYEVRSFLMAPKWLDTLADVLETAGDVPCYVAPESVVEQVTGFHVHRGALASLCRTPMPALESVLEHAERVVILEDLVDHTNVGAAFRSAAALGWDAVLLSPRCADPLYRRSIKVSMGSVFTVPYTRIEHWYDGPGTVRAAGFEVFALTPAADAVDLAEVEAPRRMALLVGTEGEGLSQRWIREADQRVRIPMWSGVESLNVAAATAVACYALRR
ncbi:RNA methyltransferase [Actinobacteria bacterium YIM 96077]|uniref:rRNA methyltransferase n=1 Tax=Phytoactinopolyspora halophila TaxID=1981511 RepID=A0A329QLK6_9ACTN|nr:RNA methyltransferase [Phytoactinopolyspora halophila]AYY12983.1 RNA methyltransferase [Actinobacteria bacterium YIM 96077]RAW13247.1 rRNA methyltransferase [Phytoactinopolyspora halophila]